MTASAASSVRDLIGSSTLLDGFYTQPLGFVLLLAWVLVYLLPKQNARQFTAAAVLLALTVLANFFNAITAIIFIASVLMGIFERRARERATLSLA